MVLVSGGYLLEVLNVVSWFQLTEGRFEVDFDVQVYLEVEYRTDSSEQH